MTLATMEAAAIEAMRASPLTMVFSRGCTWTGLPSMRTLSASTPAFSMAMAMAWRSALPMPTASIVAGSMCAMPIARATSAIFSASVSLRAGVSCLESLMPQMRGSSGRATAATVRGPAIAPRPTSSTPSTMPSPPSSRMYSYMPSTRLRSASSRSLRRRALSMACCTCLRGSSA